MSLPSQSALNNNPNNQNQNNNEYPPLPSFIDEPPSKPSYKGFSEKPHPNTALRSTNPQNPQQMPNPPVQGGPMLPAQGAPYPPAQGAPYPPGQGVPPPQGAPYPPAQGAPYPPAQGGHMPPPPRTGSTTCLCSSANSRNYTGLSSGISCSLWCLSWISLSLSYAADCCCSSSGVY